MGGEIDREVANGGGHLRLGRKSVCWPDLAACQVPTKLLYHSPSSAGQGRENITKD